MFDNVLVGVDGRQGGRDAIALARQLACADAEITLVHVYGGHVTGGRASALAIPLELEESEQLLAREAAAADLSVNTAVVNESSPGRGLHELAERRGADLLIVGSCHRGILGRAFLGDNTSRALNGAPCAIAIAPSGYAATAGRLSVLGVGLDDSAESQQALAVARELAAPTGSIIKVMAVVSLLSVPDGYPTADNWPDVAKQLMDEEFRRLRELEDVEGEVSYGEPGEELASFGEGLDLLIVGSRSYGPVGRLFNGSTSNYLARRSPCPLLVLPRAANRALQERASQRGRTRTVA
jgi:nucleotide-binding universal stress UspA family protein